MIHVQPIGGDKPLFDVEKMLSQLERDFTDLTSEGVRKMATYPVQRAGSRYRRTGTLGRSWSATPTTRSGDKIEAVIGSNSNIAPYNRDVEGDDQLPLFQALGWQNTNDLMRSLQAKVPLVIQRALQAGIV